MQMMKMMTLIIKMMKLMMKIMMQMMKIMKLMVKLMTLMMKMMTLMMTEHRYRESGQDWDRHCRFLSFNPGKAIEKVE